MRILIPNLQLASLNSIALNARHHMTPSRTKTSLESIHEQLLLVPVEARSPAIGRSDSEV